MKRFFTLFVLVTLLALTFGAPGIPPAQAAGNILYVLPYSIGNGDCSTWPDACDLQTALTNATSGDQTWVRWGTYKPTSGTDRTISFVLVDGVEMYGGFLSGGEPLQLVHL